jgi:uncharacterized protein (DUF58 family)
MSETPLDAELAERVAALRLDTSHVVEGVMSGLHRSPHRGASVVFVEHRDYRPGDDLRLLDWRAFARNDRHVTKRFEQETELSLHLWLDASASMRFGEGSREKARCAATLLAAFATLAHAQGDSVGAVRFDDAIRAELPPRTSPSHLRAVLDALAAPPSERAHTKLAALGTVAERLGRRGVVLVASDLLDLDEHALDALEHVARRGHDLRVFQILHRDELELPHDGPALFSRTSARSRPIPRRSARPTAQSSRPTSTRVDGACSRSAGATASSSPTSRWPRSSPSRCSIAVAAAARAGR